MQFSFGKPKFQNEEPRISSRLLAVSPIRTVNRQPDQRAAEGFFGAASIAQRAQQERKKQAYQAVAEIECNTLERKLPSNTRTTINRDRRRDRFQSRLFIF